MKSLLKAIIFASVVLSSVSAAQTRVVVIPLMGDDAESTWRGSWVTDFQYSEGDLVEFDGSSYIAVLNHRSSLANIPPSSEWNLVAASGANGQRGARGARGAEGDTGARGARGATGAAGAVGLTGARGATGATGPRGFTGATGSRGFTGATGATGATGPQGPAGATGPIGPQGLMGAAGASAPDPRGTPITSAPFTITAPGNYYLANNISVDQETAITINADNVVLDLNGFEVSSNITGFNFGDAIIAGFIRRNITIKNGVVQGIVGTSSSSGIFFNGISGGLNLENLRVLDTAGIRASGSRCNARIVSNVVNGDTAQSTTSTPDVITNSALISITSCDGSIFKDNIVANGLPSDPIRTGGIDAPSRSRLEGNVIRNIRNNDGACVRSLGSLGVNNIASQCTAIGTPAASAFELFSLEIGHLDQ